mgnify:CR=1 FL=1
MATTSQQIHVSIGIGVTARMHPNTKIAEWALKERSLGNKDLNEVVAIKIVLCKALEQQWSRIKIYSQNKKLLRQLKYQSPLDSSIATLIDDILIRTQPCLANSYSNNRI